MREIVFRGKRIDNGEWVEGSLIVWPDGDTEICHTKSDVIHELLKATVVPETVGQFTGMTDKNGKKIFESDICRFREWNKGEMCWIGKVHFEHQQFMISGGPNKECKTMFELCMSRFIPENIEIIGNIHDNPELIGGGEDG